MVTVILIETGQEIDVTDTSITYVKQVADIGDVTKATTSYSWGMKFPKTPRNSEIFRGLGIVGDTSTLPYKKTRVAILDNGITIVSNGLLQVRETKEDYKAFIQDGIVEFFRDVSIDKISDVIDLSELSHQNTIQTIIDSFDNDTYRYVIAGFNGPPLANVGGITNLNPFAMIPSINLAYLFDKIMDYYGWKYTGDLDLSNQWMTYPNAVGFETDNQIPPILELQASTERYFGHNIPAADGSRLIYKFSSGTLNPDFIEILNLGGIPLASFAFKQPGNYRITFSFEGTSFMRPFGSFIEVEDVKVFLAINGLELVGPPAIFTFLADSTEVSYDIVAFENTIVQFYTEMEFLQYNQFVQLQAGFFRIEQLGVQDVDFNEALIKVKVKDFFKEILTRQALTVFADIDNKTLDFVNVENRLSAQIIDWSDKYVRRVSEKYVYDSYAQNNTLEHKYDDNNEDFNDGVLVVQNENLPIEKPLFKSLTHSPLEDSITYQTTGSVEYQVPVFKMFDVETKTDPDTGDVLAEYKPIKNRFYIFEDVQVTDRIVILGNPVDGFPVAKIEGHRLKDVVSEKYNTINRILNDTRIHRIELALSKWDVATLNLKNRYYFEQESMVYLLNNLSWKNSDTCIGEFIRLSQTEQRRTDRSQTIKSQTR